MKRIFFTLILGLSIFSCKNLNIEVAPNTVNNQLIDEILKMTDSEAQKAAYKILNPNEKSIIWRTRIKSFLQLQKWNKEQVDHLNVLLGIVTPQFFDGTISEDQIKKMDKQWSPKAIELFNKEVIAPLVTSLKTLKPIAVSIHNSPQGRIGASNCECNGDSIWDCSACNGESSCQQVRDCGWFWSQQCNKSCSIPPKPQEN